MVKVWKELVKVTKEEKIMKKYSVEDTLCFFYFGITPDELNNNNSVYDKIIRKALFDATMQNAFNAKISSDDKEKAKTAKDNAVIYLEERIKKLNNLNSYDDFDNWHKITCDEIKNKFIEIKKDNKEIFTYGNAQKVVNMTFKYLYMISNSSLYNESNDVLKIVNSYSEFFHMPSDSYIIDALFRVGVLNWEEIKNENNEHLRKLVGPRQEDPRKRGRRCSEYIKISWSNWDYNLYNAVLEKIRDAFDGKCLIDCENDLWIEEAKNRRDNVKKK